MARPSAPLETYVSRVISLAMAVVSGLWAFHARSWVFGLVALVFLVGVFRVRDYATVGHWWFFVLANLGIAALLIPAWRPDASWSYLLLFACVLAQVVTLVLGRIRKVWRFTKPPEVIDVPDLNLPRKL